MIVKMEPDEFYTFRVQYLADMDPFNCLTMFPLPTRAPTFAFASSTPLATQLGAIVRLLNAPQRVFSLLYCFNSRSLSRGVFVWPFVLCVYYNYNVFVLGFVTATLAAGRCRTAGVQGRRLWLLSGPGIVAGRAIGRGGRSARYSQELAGRAHPAERSRACHHRYVIAKYYDRDGEICYVYLVAIKSCKLRQSPRPIFKRAFARLLTHTAQQTRGTANAARHHTAHDSITEMNSRRVFVNGGYSVSEGTPDMYTTHNTYIFVCTCVRASLIHLYTVHVHTYNIIHTASARCAAY